MTFARELNELMRLLPIRHDNSHLESSVILVFFFSFRCLTFHTRIFHVQLFILHYLRYHDVGFIWFHFLHSSSSLNHLVLFLVLSSIVRNLLFHRKHFLFWNVSYSLGPHSRASFLQWPVDFLESIFPLRSVGR